MTEVSSIRVYMRHVRAARICSGGTREFFKAHNLDWMAFLNDGLDEETLVRINDPLANRALAEARKEKERE